MSPRTGRPPIKNPKSERITVRLGCDESNILNKYCEQEHLERAEAIRRGIRKLETDIKE